MEFSGARGEVSIEVIAYLFSNAEDDNTNIVIEEFGGRRLYTVPQRRKICPPHFSSYGCYMQPHLVLAISWDVKFSIMIPNRYEIIAETLVCCGH